MAKKHSEPTIKPRERAFLVGVELRDQDRLLSLDESLTELALLADTAGLDVVGQTTQRLNRPNSKTFIGSGKVEEVKTFVNETDAEIVLFDDELAPRHQRELEVEFGDDIRIIDRTALILDIFAQHANTSEGALQVELAQYEYRLPRLTRAWTHLARQAGGGGGRAGSVGGVGLRGPGEKQLEVDRRDIRRRIDFLKRDIEKVRTHRQMHRERRRRSRIPVVALVGYTNAGKSTLLNQISEANVYVADQLFATLDPTTRRVNLADGNMALFTDTVGFIQKLPTNLVAAFRATLEEIAEADLLVHVVDVTHPNAKEQAASVLETLVEIDADHVPLLTALNKIDRLKAPEKAADAMDDFTDTVAISALHGDGIDQLLNSVSEKLYETYTPITVNLPYQEGALIAMFHDQALIDSVENKREGVRMSGRLPGRLVARFMPFIDGKEDRAEDESYIPD